MSARLPQGQGMARLLDIMARLRAPEGGCPWDLEQDFASIAPYTLEEAYEVAEAIEQDDPQALCDELGDLLFQVVFHAQMAREKGWFDFTAVVESINDKMIRRHPHVFADASIEDARQQTEAWEAQKARERADKSPHAGLLDGVSLALPALTRARKLQSRAARVGFDWHDGEGVLDKMEEELAELRQAWQQHSRLAIDEEVGDLLFTLVNLARHQELDPEASLRAANSKFERRFAALEAAARQQGRDLREWSLEEMDAEWTQVKQRESSPAQ